MASILRTQTVTTAWAPLPNDPAGSVSVLNNTGADLLVASTDETGTAAKVATLKDGQSVGLKCDGLGRASQFSIKAAAEVAGVQIVLDR